MTADDAAREAYPGWQSEVTGRHRVQRKEHEAFVAGAAWQRDQRPDLPQREAVARAIHQALASDWMTVMGALDGDQGQYERLVTDLADAALSAIAPVQPVLVEVATERDRQVTDEGHAPERDDAKGALALGTYASDHLARGLVQGNRSDLIRAAALVVAAVETVDRLLSFGGTDPAFEGSAPVQPMVECDTCHGSGVLGDDTCPGGCDRGARLAPVQPDPLRAGVEALADGYGLIAGSLSGATIARTLSNLLAETGVPRG